MEPPICAISGEPFDPADGRRVRFIATDAGRAFEEAARPGLFVGDSPDEAWFSAAYADAAERLAGTHTLADAVRQLRADDARAAWERRAQTQTRHDIDPPVPAQEIVEAIRSWLPAALAALELSAIEPQVEERRSTSPGPEWREDATTTELASTETWEAGGHRVVHGVEDIRWDGADGRPRTGDLLQGVVSLKIDDTWLFAPFGGDAMVDHIDLSGERTAEIAALVDGLLRSVGAGG